MSKGCKKTFQLTRHSTATSTYRSDVYQVARPSPQQTDWSDSPGQQPNAAADLRKRAINCGYRGTTVRPQPAKRWRRRWRRLVEKIVHTQCSMFIIKKTFVHVENKNSYISLYLEFFYIWKNDRIMLFWMTERKIELHKLCIVTLIMQGCWKNSLSDYAERFYKHRALKWFQIVTKTFNHWRFYIELFVGKWAQWCNQKWKLRGGSFPTRSLAPFVFPFFPLFSFLFFPCFLLFR